MRSNVPLVRGELRSGESNQDVALASTTMLRDLTEDEVGRARSPMSGVWRWLKGNVLAELASALFDANQCGALIGITEGNSFSSGLPALFRSVTL